MKRIVLSGMSTLLIAIAIAPAAKAQTAGLEGIQNNSEFQTTPEEVVTLAERGYFEEQGLPQGNTLISAYTFGRLTAQDVVQAAVDAQRVPASVLEDEGYLLSVEYFLEDRSGYGSDN